MRKIIISVPIFLLSLLVRSQVKNNVEQIQGTWKHINDEGVYLTIVKTIGNKWYEVIYEKQGNNNEWIKEKASATNTTTFHFINDCPSRYSNATYTIEDTDIVSSCFIKIYLDSFSLCYNIDFHKDSFSLQWSEKVTNIFDYYRMNMKPIRVEKSNIYNAKKELTGMYLSKGDEVEVIKGGGDWIEIKYYGQRIVDGWIKREDIE